MVALTTREPVSWLAPSPMWRRGQGAAMRQPQILRFDSDDFMDQFLALMRYRPQQLAEWRARPETWRKPSATPPTAAVLQRREPLSTLTEGLSKAAARRSPSAESPDADRNHASDREFKLYQPAHQRFYLVAAALVCDRPGLPHRLVDARANERAGFVMRRVVSPTEADNPPTEYAFVQTAEGFRWQELAADARLRLAPSEERLGLFNLDYTEPTGHPRRLFAGLIPVSKRETYHAALVVAGDGRIGEGVSGNDGLDPRKALFMSTVIAPWKALLEHASSVRRSLVDARTTLFDQSGVSDDDKQNGKRNELQVIDAARDQIQTGSWYVLLDFAKFLQEHAPKVWSAVCSGVSRDELSVDEQMVLDWIDLAPELESASAEAPTQIGDLVAGTAYATDDVKHRLRDALQAILPESASEDSPEIRLEEVETLYDRRKSEAKEDWPEFLFPLAEPAHRFGIQIDAVDDERAVPGDLTFGAVPDGSTVEIDDDILVDPSDPLDVRLAVLDTLANRVGRALSAAEGVLPEIPLVDQTKVALEDYRFVIRCVYEQPNCGPLQPAVLSEPTESFQLASFFDPDAPGRALRIPMPLDISPAGLRKFNRNAGFVISDMFCGQLKRMRRYSLGDLVLSVLPWPFHKDLPDPGAAGPCEKGGNRLGMVCSLSIPIVTICAFVLLIIMVTLFDIFFRWIPYLFTCLPIPGLTAKKT